MEASVRKQPFCREAPEAWPPLTVLVWNGYQLGGNISFFTGTQGHKACKMRFIEQVLATEGAFAQIAGLHNPLKRVIGSDLTSLGLLITLSASGLSEAFDYGGGGT